VAGIRRNTQFSESGWIFEFKWDGYRVLASKQQLLTRNRKDAGVWYPEVLQALPQVRGSFILDEEICLFDDEVDQILRAYGPGLCASVPDLLCVRPVVPERP
jgi:ATP-dependent DNA ligase